MLESFYGRNRELARIIRQNDVPVPAAFFAVASFVLLKVIGLVAALKVDRRAEGLGLDVSQHGEEAYADDEGAILILPGEVGHRRADVPALAAAAAEGGRS